MKTITLFLAFVLISIGSVFAQDFNEVPGKAPYVPSYEQAAAKGAGFLDDIKVSLNTTFASRYWGSIVGGIFYAGGAVNFTTLTFSKDSAHGNTYVYGGMINPLDTTKYDYKGGTEYYLAVGHTFSLWESGPDNLPLIKVNVMVLYDAISKISNWSDDVIEELVRVDFPRVPVAQPYVEYYHWDTSGNDSPDTGSFGRVGIKRQQPLGFSLFGSPVSLGIDLSAGYCGGTFGTSKGLAYYRAVISSEIKVNKNLKILPSIVGQLPGDGQEVGRAFVDRPRLFYNLGLQWDF